VGNPAGRLVLAWPLAGLSMGRHFHGREARSTADPCCRFGPRGGHSARGWSAWVWLCLREVWRFVRAIFAPRPRCSKPRPAARPAPRPPGPQPPEPFVAPGHVIRKRREGDRRRPPPDAQQCPRGSAKSDEANRPPRGRVPLCNDALALVHRPCGPLTLTQRHERVFA